MKAKNLFFLRMFHPYAEARMDKGMRGEISPFKLLSAIGSLVSVSAFTYCRVQKKPDYANRFRAGTIFAIYQVKVLV
jgi:hypothetical protein